MPLLTTPELELWERRYVLWEAKLLAVGETPVPAGDTVGAAGMSGARPVLLLDVSGV